MFIYGNFCPKTPLVVVVFTCLPNILWLAKQHCFQTQTRKMQLNLPSTREEEEDEMTDRELRRCE